MKVITAQKLRQLDVCMSSVTSFESYFPKGLFVEPLYGDGDAAKELWRFIFDHKFLRNYIGWAAEKGLIPQRINVPLDGFNLAGADLSGMDLSEMDLDGMDLSWANLDRANLNKASLVKANLTNANLTEANLIEANLTSAQLDRAILYGASIDGINLDGASMEKTRFTKVQVIEVRMCLTCNGSGIQVNPIWTQYFEEGPPEFSEEQVCQWFRDNGLPVHSEDDYPPEEVYCCHCDGSGEISKQIDLVAALHDLGILQSPS